MRCIVPLVLAACASAPLEVPITPGPDHPFVADAAWPISHGSSYARGSVPQPGLPEADAYDVDFVASGIPSITLATAPP